MTALKRLALALASAGMLGAYAQYPAAAFLPWFALVPWVVLHGDDRAGPVPIRYYVFATWLTWVLQHPQPFKYGWYAPLVMAAEYFFWWIPFAPILSRLRHRLGVPLVLATPLAWTTTEWLRTTMSFSNFDLYGIGYSQARFPVLVQFADITGSYGVSFMVAAVNGLVAAAVLAVRDRGLRDGLRDRTIGRGALAVGAALAAIVSYGAYRLATVTHVPGPRLALVQPNVPHLKGNMIGLHLSQLLLTARNVEPGAADMVVWPENAILDNIRRPGAYLEDLAWMADDLDAWLVVGAFGKSRTTPGRTTNSAFLIDPAGSIRDSYDKQVLFPWTEEIPADAFLGRVAPGVQRVHRALIRRVWGLQATGEKGTETRVFEMPWGDATVRFSPLICVENTYPPLPAEAGALGADFFLNITSEGSVGGPVQEQLLRIAMLRAIENRMSYVRVGNTGISGVIDAVGRLRAILRGRDGRTIDTPGVLITEIPLSHSPRTVYARSGEAFVKVVLAVTAALLAASFFRRRRGAGVAVVAATALLAGCGGLPELGGDPGQVDANLRRGAALLEAGRPGQAIEPLAAACGTEEGCRLALPALLKAYDAGVTDDEAVLVFREIGERYPALAAEALSYEAIFLNRTVELQAAREAYERSLALAPSARVYGLLGNLLMRMERTDEAIETFRAGLEIAPDDLQLRFVCARALRIRGDDDGAVAMLEAILQTDPTHGSAWTNLARIRLRGGDEEGAREALRTAVRVEPTIIEARFLLARLALREGDLDRVAALIEEIREIEAGLGRGPARDATEIP